MNSILSFLSFYLGSNLCFYTQLQLEISPILTSCCVGLLGTLIPNKKYSAAIYSGSFVGVCGETFINSHFEIALASTVGGIFTLLLQHRLDGYGGKLGTIAFLGSTSLLVLRYIS